MLVVISDLHLVSDARPEGANDPDPIRRNVSSGAFDIWREDIRVLAKNCNAEEIVFLYLGDMIDLLRTEHWFDVPREDRPWGNAKINEAPHGLSEECRAHALAILDRIAVDAKEQLDALAGRGAWSDFGVKTTVRAYVPGNHDRLYYVDDAVRAKINALLGVSRVEGYGLPSTYRDLDYGFLARHGHEFDVWNFEDWNERWKEGDPLSPSSYLKVPIGDPITTELLTRLPHEVWKALDGKVDDVPRRAIYRSLLDIENVRPLHAAIPWIFYAAERGPGPSKCLSEKDKPVVKRAITDTVQRVFEDFMQLEFVERWIRDHDSWMRPFEAADKLQLLAALSQVTGDLGAVSSVLKIVHKLHLDTDEPLPQGALKAPVGDAWNGIQHIVYGHTHEFDQRALCALGQHDRVYLNSGTWRPRYRVAMNNVDFASWKEMTYLVFYRPDEIAHGRTKRRFETWTGSLAERDDG